MGNIRSTVSAFKVVSAATTNANVVKATPGNLYTITATNYHATVAKYLKIYDVAGGVVVVGTTVPVLVIQVPPVSVVTHLTFGTFGLAFANGIGIAITLNAIDTDTTAVTAAEVKACLAYS